MKKLLYLLLALLALAYVAYPIVTSFENSDTTIFGVVDYNDDDTQLSDVEEESNGDENWLSMLIEKHPTPWSKSIHKAD
ncbi:hypothetical protein [Streptococcus henryi]|uniref:hypothetical protein n=1 Tax=Streptococcus henryi TaxID=439219 RepID=UPI00038097D0|nr:hypothetical protein [Streptococcus henryi]